MAYHYTLVDETTIIMGTSVSERDVLLLCVLLTLLISALLAVLKMSLLCTMNIFSPQCFADVHIYGHIPRPSLTAFNLARFLRATLKAVRAIESLYGDEASAYTLT